MQVSWPMIYHPDNRNLLQLCFSSTHPQLNSFTIIIGLACPPKIDLRLDWSLWLVLNYVAMNEMMGSFLSLRSILTQSKKMRILFVTRLSDQLQRNAWFGPRIELSAFNMSLSFFDGYYKFQKKTGWEYVNRTIDDD